MDLEYDEQLIEVAFIVRSKTSSISFNVRFTENNKQLYVADIY